MIPKTLGGEPGLNRQVGGGVSHVRVRREDGEELRSKQRLECARSQSVCVRVCVCTCVRVYPCACVSVRVPVYVVK